MRIYTFVACVMVCIPIAASAATTSASFTAADQARFARIVPLTGTWSCSDTGGDKPYTATVKVEGAWVVWREKTDDPATEYIRWNHNLKSYVVAEVESSGGLEVSTTTGSDPLNASWKPQFPPEDSDSSFNTSFSNGIFKVVAKYVDKNGKSRIGQLICKKA
jgi:hypothetical protein